MKLPARSISVRLLVTSCALLLFSWVGNLRSAEISFEKADDGVTVKIDGKLFTRYLIRSGAKPVLWPIVGPTGKHITRGYPLLGKKTAGEREDHIHHRSFWFTHGDVNGVDFWGEGKNGGTIIHRKFVKVAGGANPVIVTINDWMDSGGKKVCEDERTLHFGADQDSRWIDFDVTVRATAGKVTFGDTKEGSFGIRIAGTMKVSAKQGGKIINSEGQTDANAWGKPAAWVDYHGPVNGQRVGIAILNHPSSFRYPTYWHVRTYGLFAANPFGLHHFKGDKNINAAHTLLPGETFTLRYRVIFHKGDEIQGKIKQAFDAYSRKKIGS